MGVMIPQWLRCLLWQHDWFTFHYYEHVRRRCQACGQLQQRTRWPGEYWYPLDRTGTYRKQH